MSKIFSYFKKEKKMSSEVNAEKSQEQPPSRSNLTSLEQPQRPELAKHDTTILDLAFVMDCTGSMGSYIQSATDVSLLLCLFHSFSFCIDIIKRVF